MTLYNWTCATDSQGAATEHPVAPACPICSKPMVIRSTDTDPGTHEQVTDPAAFWADLGRP